MKQFKELWAKLDDKKKKNVMVAAIVFGFLIMALIGYGMKAKGKSGGRAVVIGDTGRKEVSLDVDLLKKTQYTESRRKMDDLEKQLEDLKKQKELLGLSNPQGGGIGDQQMPPQPGAAAPPGTNGMFPVGSTGATANIQAGPFSPAPTASATSVPPIPPPPSAGPIPPPPPPPKASGDPMTAGKGGVAANSFPSTEVFGEIAMEPNKYTPPAAKEDEKDEKKKESTKVFLPSSFMEATLLSGLYAKTASGGTSGEIPVLIRIKDVAVLPNKIKANLKGCFVIAEGHGDLSDERAHMRLVSMTCLDRKGNSVIDQKIKGFLVDTDGKIGLKGRVVSKMGSAIARSVLAGFVKGFGEAIKSQAQTLTTTGSGVVTSFDPAKAVQAGMGAGISSGMDELTRFYLDLAKASVPVIEVGALKTVTLVTTEGQDLEIKDVCLGGGGSKCE